jgi:hypothetical protein
MKSLKSISLAITMLICFVTFGQENDSIAKLNPFKKENIRYCIGCPKDGKEILIIVDDLWVNKSMLSKINANNIESVNIVKGEKAFLLYGEKGKNGAIIITTKKLSRKQKKHLKRQSKIELQIQEYQKAKAINLKN